jgi:hypothetical protein
MINHPELFNTAINLWSDRHVEGAVKAYCQREYAYDDTAIVMTTQNYSKRRISNLELCRVDGTQNLMRLIECYLTRDLLQLADQLEKVAGQIRGGLR